MSNEFDLLSLNSPVSVKTEINHRDLFVTERCSFCKSTNLNYDSKEITCISCGEVQGTIILFKDRRCYDQQQTRSRATQHPVSIRSWSPLSTRIGTGGVTNQKAIELKKKQKFLLTVEEHEMREVIRIITNVADEGKLNLTKKEIELLIIDYRKKHLGKKIAVGRPRVAVILAYIFLELRMTKMREYLSYNEFLNCINMRETLVFDDENIDADDLKRTMTDDFGSALSHLVREFGYTLRQSSLNSIIFHLTMIMGIPRITRKALLLGKILRPYYKNKSVKFAGLAGGIVFIICKMKNKRVTKRSVTRSIAGVNSPATIKNRLSEMPTFIKLFLKRFNKRSDDYNGLELIRYEEIMDVARDSLRVLNFEAMPNQRSC